MNENIIFIYLFIIYSLLKIKLNYRKWWGLVASLIDVWSLVFLLVWIRLFMKIALGFMQVNCINL